MNSQATPHPASPQPTGDFLVMFDKSKKARQIDKLFADSVGLKLAHSSDFEVPGNLMAQAFEETGALSIDRLGIAIVKGEDGEDRLSALSALQSRDDVLEVRPEFWMYSLQNLEARYRNWVREGLSLLADPELADRLPGMPSPRPSPSMDGTPDATWGLIATGVTRSRYGGKGIRVAVLDTGMDLAHPDFAGRTIVSESFVPDEAVQDLQGHGTHCIGTACGPKSPAGQMRYGVAYEAEIFVGKVLNNSGSGREGWILAGIEWAVEAGCHIISMSLGRSVRPNEPADPIYESAGEYALENASLIIAAAGNDSWRSAGHVAPVNAPASSRSIMAVGALDEALQVANFSCGGVNPDGGNIDIAGPGVDVLSSMPMPRQYARLNGTSMATPHVAGIAALRAEADSRMRGDALRGALVREARALPGLWERDVGSGLVQAPE